MALLVVISMMTGFDQDLGFKILSVNAHIICPNRARARRHSDSNAVAREVGQADPRRRLGQAFHLYPGDVLRLRE